MWEPPEHLSNDSNKIKEFLEWWATENPMVDEVKLEQNWRAPHTPHLGFMEPLPPMIPTCSIREILLVIHVHSTRHF